MGKYIYYVEGVPTGESTRKIESPREIPLSDIQYIEEYLGVRVKLLESPEFTYCVKCEGITSMSEKAIKPAKCFWCSCS